MRFPAQYDRTISQAVMRNTDSLRLALTGVIEPIYVACMSVQKARGRDQQGATAISRRNDSRLSRVPRAKASLRHLRFSAGLRLGVLELSPRLTGKQREALQFWIRRMPQAFRSRLPKLKLAVAGESNSQRKSVCINEKPFLIHDAPRERTHAVSFIPQRYIVLDASLFRQRVEVGRILYHELSHFLWPRLGNPKRRRFQAVLQRELQERARGELGYSSEQRKSSLIAEETSGVLRASLGRKQLDYSCESFCDTGAYVLLGKERRERHSEYTLSATARRRRCSIWRQIVLAGGRCDA